MKIVELQFFEICLPLKQSVKTSMATVSKRPIILMKSITSEGIEAWSECVVTKTPFYTSECIDTAWFILNNFLGPKILDLSWNHPRDMGLFLKQCCRGHYMAKACIEMNLWLLYALGLSKPLTKVLGGIKDRVKAGVTLGVFSSKSDYFHSIDQMLDKGYHRIKMKVTPQTDLTIFQMIREKFGMGLQLMVDANASYIDVDRSYVHKLDFFHFLMIEQPLYWDDIYEHALLQKKMRTPICLDESIASLEHVNQAISQGCAKIICIKPARVGGFSESLAIYELCLSKGIPMWCGGMFETGLGRSYNLALASLEGFVLPGDFTPSDHYWERDIVDPELNLLSDGYMTVNMEKPGLGVCVDEDRIIYLSTRKKVLKK